MNGFYQPSAYRSDQIPALPRAPSALIEPVPVVQAPAACPEASSPGPQPEQQTPKPAPESTEARIAAHRERIRAARAAKASNS